MVEIKFIFTESQAIKARTVFELTQPPVARTVSFFDTSDCKLFHGTIARPELKLILRARLVKGKKHGITTLKIRTEGKLGDSFQTDVPPGAKREFDYAYGRTLLDSYSLESDQDAGEMKAVLDGHRHVKKIFDQAQQTLIDKEAGKNFPWTDLRIFGPVSQVQVWEKLQLKGLDGRFTCELWDLPDSTNDPARQLLELSTRTGLDQQETTVARLVKLLERNGIHPETTTTKTQTVLKHFSPGKHAK